MTQRLPYLPAMFATCMLYQVIYMLCVGLWFFAPDLRGHAMLADIFPQFTLLNVPSFVYGLIASAFYGWVVAVVFVFFYNLWPSVVGLISGRNVART